MRCYLLDTALVVAYLYDRPAAVELIDPWLARREAATSVLVYAEASEYIQGRRAFPNDHQALRTLPREVLSVGLNYPMLDLYGDLRRRLRPPYGPGLIGDIDTLIAATAIVRGLVLVTTDSDFQRVPGLQFMHIPRSALRA